MIYLIYPGNLLKIKRPAVEEIIIYSFRCIFFDVDLTANMLHLIRHVFVDASKRAEHSIIISTPQIPLLLYSIGYATSLSGPV